SGHAAADAERGAGAAGRAGVGCERVRRSGSAVASAGRSDAMKRRLEDGFALVIVLWTLVLLTLLVSGLTASGRGEVKLAENLRDAAVAEAATDGATQEAIFRLVAGQWAPTAVPHDMRFGGAVVTVRIQDEA